MKFKSKILALVVLGLSGNACASLVQINDPGIDLTGLNTAENGFNITYDNINKVKWLDWSITLGKSYTEIYALTLTGQALEGWKYATEQQFKDLATAAGIPGTFFDATSSGSDAEFTTLNSYLGTTGTVGGTSFTRAFSGVSNSSGTHALGGFDSSYSFFEVPNGTSIAFNAYWNDGTASASVGHALVQVVPIPTAIWLFVSGLIGLTGLMRRKA